VARIGGYVMIPSMSLVAVLSFPESDTWLESAGPLSIGNLWSSAAPRQLQKIRGPAELLSNFRTFDPVVTGATENAERDHWPSLIAIVRYLFGEPLDKN
jgi:hypothetical protein